MSTGTTGPDSRRAQCLTWVLASRARLAAALGDRLARAVGSTAGTAIPDAGDREALLLRGDLYLGIVALDQALTSARWAAGAPAEGSRGAVVPARGAARPPVPSDAADDLPMPLAELEAARQRVRSVRNLIVHLDDRRAASLPAALDVDPAGVRASQGGAASSLTFDEWAGWLDALEAWASAGLGAAGAT